MRMQYIAQRTCFNGVDFLFTLRAMERLGGWKGRRDSLSCYNVVVAGLGQRAEARVAGETQRQ